MTALRLLGRGACILIRTLWAGGLTSKLLVLIALAIGVGIFGSIRTRGDGPCAAARPPRRPHRRLQPAAPAVVRQVTNESPRKRQPWHPTQRRSRRCLRLPA